MAPADDPPDGVHGRISPGTLFDCALIECPGRVEGLIQINQRRILSVVYGPYRIRHSLYLDMSTLDNAASPPMCRDETVRIALLPAFAGGYLDAHTWILHGVRANARTANLIFLWVHRAYATGRIPGWRLSCPWRHA
jgi:hypothetical protein